MALHRVMCCGVLLLLLKIAAGQKCNDEGFYCVSKTQSQICVDDDPPSGDIYTCPPGTFCSMDCPNECQHDVPCTKIKADVAETTTETVPPTNDVTTTETEPPTNDVTTVETEPPTNDVTTTETVPPTNDVTTIETVPPINDVTTTETVPPTNDITITETVPPANDVTTTESIPPINDVTTTETVPPTNDVTITETVPPTNDITTTETVTPTNDVTATETVQPTNDVTATEAATTPDSTLPTPAPTKPATDAPLPDYKCEGTGRIPDYKNCSNYYICIQNADGSFYQAHNTCPKNATFNSETKRCSLSSQAVCGAAPPTTTPSYSRCTSTGKFPDNSNCSLYYVCTPREGEAGFHEMTYKCPGSSQFNVVTKRCSVASTAVCGAAPVIKDEVNMCVKEGRFGVTKNCYIYYTCTRESNGKYVQRNHTCPLQSQYDTYRKRCSYSLLTICA